MRKHSNHCAMPNAAMWKTERSGDGENACLVLTIAFHVALVWILVLMTPAFCVADGKNRGWVYAVIGVSCCFVILVAVALLFIWWVPEVLDVTGSLRRHRKFQNFFFFCLLVSFCTQSGQSKVFCSRDTQCTEVRARSRGPSRLNPGIFGKPYF